MVALVTRILAATDFSPTADRAMEYALSMAQSWNAELHVLHVVEWYPGMDPDHAVNRMYLTERRQEADRQFQRIKEKFSIIGRTVQPQTVVGVPSEQIEHIARALSADLIVLGTQGRTGLEHILFGSTAERIVRSAPCPVVTVRTYSKDIGIDEQSGSRMSVDRILAPIDFSTCSLDALEYSAHFAKATGALVTLLHSLEPIAYNLDFTLDNSHRRERAYWEDRLDVLRAILESNGVRVECALRTGRPAESVASFLKQRPHDLVIMGTHGRRGMGHLLVGSVAEMTLRFASCPVLTIRRSPFGPHHERLLPAATVE
jgi:nucleotide-binding universal stress UspA family protein